MLLALAGYVLSQCADRGSRSSKWRRRGLKEAPAAEKGTALRLQAEALAMTFNEASSFKAAIRGQRTLPLEAPHS